MFSKVQVLAARLNPCNVPDSLVVIGRLFRVTSCSRNIRWAKAGQGDAVHVREGEVVGGEHPPEKILGAEEGPEEVEDKER